MKRIIEQIERDEEEQILIRCRNVDHLEVYYFEALMKNAASSVCLGICCGGRRSSLRERRR